MRWKTSENCVPRGTQGYVGGPMRWGTNGNRVKRVRLGDQ